ncbi:MAG: protein phosphatase 2C domain-containing protein [Bifidobacteriaceae bacterium]|nr:protein phosphatase 2C domain-containing protein [Bifidobacteriaceae bacterium]
MTIALRYAVRSDIGLTRANNQDSAYAGPHLMVVADGMGGHAGGDIASSVAIAHLAPLDEEALTSDQGPRALEAAVEAAHEELLERVEEDPELAGLGTTITTLLRAGDRLILGHIGDSRAYLMRKDRFEQVTTDHTFVQYLVDAGKLDPDQAERHPQRSLLLRVLGDVELSGGLDISVRKAEPGDRWLLCSDGLSGVVSAATLRRTLAEEPDPDRCADQLIELALRGGGPDNVTCVVADVVDIDNLPADEVPPTAAQVVGAAAIDRHRPTRGGGGAAAKAASLAPAQPADHDEPELADSRRRRPVGRRLIWAAIILAVLALAAGGVYWAYAWSQDQYYVGQSDGQIVIYRGIPQEVFGFALSQEVERFEGYDFETDLSEAERQMVEESALSKDTQEQAAQWVHDAVARTRANRAPLGDRLPGAPTASPSTPAASPRAPTASPSSPAAAATSPQPAAGLNNQSSPDPGGSGPSTHPPQES